MQNPLFCYLLIYSTSKLATHQFPVEVVIVSLLVCKSVAEPSIEVTVTDTLATLPELQSVDCYISAESARHFAFVLGDGLENHLEIF